MKNFSEKNALASQTNHGGGNESVPVAIGPFFEKLGQDNLLFVNRRLWNPTNIVGMMVRLYDYLVVSRILNSDGLEMFLTDMNF